MGNGKNPGETPGFPNQKRARRPAVPNNTINYYTFDIKLFSKDFHGDLNIEKGVGYSPPKKTGPPGGRLWLRFGFSDRS